MDNMEIKEYTSRYEKEVNALFVQLQTMLVSMDSEKVQCLTEEYKDRYLNYVLTLLKEHQGQMLVSVENEKVLGVIAGYIEEKDEEDILTNICPKRGIISELIVNENCRNKGVGRKLIASMEEYFKFNHCQYVSINVFAPNQNAQDFYKSNHYFQRNIELIKKLN